MVNKKSKWSPEVNILIDLGGHVFEITESHSTASQ